MNAGMTLEAVLLGLTLALSPAPIWLVGLFVVGLVDAIADQVGGGS